MVIYEKRNYKFNKNLNKTIVNNIVKYRKLKGYTQEELAYYTGLSNEFIRRVETSKGARGYSVNTIYKMSVVLDVRIDKFFEEN